MENKYYLYNNSLCVSNDYGGQQLQTIVCVFMNNSWVNQSWHSIIITWMETTLERGERGTLSGIHTGLEPPTIECRVHIRTTEP